MIAFDQWVYSQDMARWLFTRPALSLAEQMDCILSAPHRSLEEKLEGLRELQREAGKQTLPEGRALEQKYPEDRIFEQKLLEDKIEAVETLLEVLSQPGGMRNLYEADIFHYGRKEECSEKRIFTLPGAGMDFIREQIKEAAGRYEVDTKCFFGVLYKYYRRGSRHPVCEWDVILDSEGRVLYCLPEMSADNQGNDYWIGPQDYSYMRLPYPTGTIVETVDSPFFQPVKGVVVNQKEPWEEGFGEEGAQWLLYADFLHGSNRTGIGVIEPNHYASITFGADFILPFVQFFRR